MGIELIFVVFAFALVLLTNGSLKKLFSTSLKSRWLIVPIVAGYLAIDFAPIPKSRYDDVGISIVLATYILFIGFLLLNASFKSLWIAIIGLVSNTIVIAVNLGMPVKSSGDYVALESIKYQASTSKDLLAPISDIFMIKPLRTSLSIGDIIFGVGIVVACLVLSRKKTKNETVEPQEFEMVEIEDDNFANREELVLEDKSNIVNQPVVFKIESAIMHVTEMDNDLEFIEQVQVLDARSEQDERQDEEVEYVVVDAPEILSSNDTKVELEQVDEAKIIDLVDDAEIKDAKHIRPIYKSSSRRKSYRKKVGILALPTKEELGYNEESMKIVDAAE